ncbi:MAG: radical SAM protein [Planctomycetota bacterium]|nr:radical SAM protein [Planctomycetota bacterium]
MIRVALVNPPFSKLVYGEEHTIKSITPCLGLFYLQSYCDDIAHIKVFEGEFYDSMVHLIAAIGEFEPDILGVTTNTTTWPLCAQLARASNARLKLCGGPYAAFRVDECLQDFDAVFLGDGEVSLRRLLESGGNLRATPGIGWRDADLKVHRNVSAPLIELDEIPYPNHDQMQLGLYQSSPHRDLPEPFATMVTTRGCGFRCTFCLSAVGGLNNGRYRERSVTNVVGELKVLRSEHGIRSIQFWDDTFTMRKSRTREMCAALSELDIAYICNTRTDKIDAETADLLARSGCKGVFFGVESGAQLVLDGDHKKGVVNQQVVDAVDHCKRAGIRTTTSFIFGSIDDTSDTIEESIAFSLELDSDYILYNIYTAHPGTAGYARAVREGVIDHYGVDILRWTGEPVGVPTICKNLPREKLHRLKTEAYIRYYRRRGEYIYAGIIETYESELARMGG